MKHILNRSELSSEQAVKVRGHFQGKQKDLAKYIDRLLWWNKRVNLVSRDVSRETIENHVLHSLVITESLLYKKANEIIDSGTGGGLPGIPLSIVDPSKNIRLNDVVSKKVMACKHMANELGLKNIESESGSVEDMNFSDGVVLISKHAFKINDLLEMIGEKPWSGIILLKGGEEVESELTGIEEELEINICALEPGFKDTFFNGKAMVEIKRKSSP